MSGPTSAELQQAREYAHLLPALAAHDVVFALKPDGEELLIKGRDFLDAVIAKKQDRPMRCVHVAVLTDEVAAALESLLGKDGCFTAPGVVGHA